MLRHLLLLICTITFSFNLHASKLQSGYDAKEYIEIMSFQLGQILHSDSVYPESVQMHRFREVYKSPETGLQNQWSLWVGSDSVAVIKIRGTVGTSESWLANLYAGMIAAKGYLVLAPGDTFNYHFASDEKAAVHVGWTLSTAYLIRDILPRLDSCYRSGIKDFIITGHSQGGAIAYLITAFLYNYRSEHKIPDDITFKTYCSAAPKPGNLYFAYEYENKTRNGWAFNVVNSADWVPEAPLSIQTVNDFNKTNPLVNARKGIRKQKFPTRLVMMYVFNRLRKTPIKAMHQYKKYLGNYAGKLVIRDLPNLQPPKYADCNAYVRTGTTIVLFADEQYFKRFPENNSNIFAHHLFAPYLYLANKRK
ncbi:MAG: lipase family protein [Bacteroidetes bacterium]|jgi:hypothetical protein|nr:lipase family protein [Bacteroidota bacterium]